MRDIRQMNDKTSKVLNLTPVRKPEGMAGLAKGLAIIEAFGAEHDYLTVAQAAQVAGISRASARRCLLTLSDLGYLFKYGSQFRPTPRMLRLGAAYSETATLPQLAQAHLEAARDELRESISLAILEQGNSVFIARAEAERIVSSVVRLGGRLPAYASATGRVLLASLQDEELEKYLASITPEAFTKATITDKGELKRRIQLTRENHVEITDEELEQGMVSMAVPISDADGRTVAAMSMSASSGRISADRMRREFFPVLSKYADALARSL